MSLSRRAFLKVGVATAGGGVALAARSSLVKAGLPVLDRVVAERLHRDVPDSWVPSLCGACSAACPLLLRKVGDTIVGVRALDPKPCARAFAIPQDIKHVDRLAQSLKAEGARGSGSWSTIDRATAIGELAQALAASGPSSALVVRDDALASTSLIQALAGALGSTNIYSMSWAQAEGPFDVWEESTGWAHWRFDLPNVAGIVSFGWDWLQNSPSPPEAQQGFATIRKHDAPMLYIGPRLNVTAMRSRRWIACRPGFEAFLAAGVARELLGSGSYDKAACENASGFAAYAEELEKLDVSACEEKAGARAGSVAQIAKVLADRPHVLCVSGRSRWQDETPVMVLNAILGNIGREGGVQPVPEVSLPGVSSPEEKHVEDLPEAILQGKPLDTLVLVDVNPALTSVQPSRWEKALGKVPHVIAVSSRMNETAALADLVIPLALAQERSDIRLELGASGIEPVAVAPAVEPPGDALSPQDLALALAERLGDRVQGKFRYASLADFVKDLHVQAPAVSGFQFPAPAEWKPPAFSDGTYHLLLESPAVLPHLDGAHLPYLLTTLGPHLRQWWNTWVEINPETASRLGIRPDEVGIKAPAVVVESAAGSVRARARIWAGVGPDAICMPPGMGRSVGHFTDPGSGNPLQLLEYHSDDRTHAPLWNLQKVTIRRSV